MEEQSLENRREEYKRATLNEDSVEAQPILQFKKWFGEVEKSSIKEPYAMALATANAQGMPSVRMVLLRQCDENGFVFYSNYNSRKGKELAENSQASLLFFWDVLEQQVRIEGTVELLSAEESTAYFNKRPHKSQLAALASEQSEVIESRKVLEDQFEVLNKQYDPKYVVPRPSHWGGYRLIPDAIEFWQGRPSRMHDRIVYKKENDNWKIERLAP